MKAQDICRVLTELNIAHYPDSCNPDYTIHLAEGKHDGTLIDADEIDRELNRWEVVPVDRHALSAEYKRLYTEAELRAWVKQEFNKE